MPDQPSVQPVPSPPIQPQTPSPQTPQIQPLAPSSPPVPSKHQPLSDRLRASNVLELLFRLGFASIFLANSWVALTHPGSFLDLVESNFASRFVGHYSLQVYAIAINDGLLGLLVLSGFKKKYVYAWAGVWLLVVTFFKITSLI